MIFYRLALQRLIEYLNLDQLFKEDEQRLKLLQKHKHHKTVYKIVLKTDETWNFYVSVLLSVISILVCLSIPFAALESPCDIFIKNDLFILHKMATFIYSNVAYLDILILLFIVLLVLVSIKTVIDAIRNTNISISPWIERGRYTLPPKVNTNRQRNFETSRY